MEENNIISNHLVNYRYKTLIYNNSGFHYTSNTSSRYCFVELICNAGKKVDNDIIKGSMP